jgi:uncharacterized protein YfaP (DUF2135 family)
MRRTWVITSLLTALSGPLVSCGRSSSSPFSSTAGGTLTIDQIVTSASTDGREGNRSVAAAPPPAGGPTITAAGNQNVVNGGTLAVAIQSAVAFTRVYLYVGGKTLGLASETPGGIAGHYDIPLASAQTSAALLITFPQEIPVRDFQLLFAVADAAGIVGPYAPLAAQVTQVGTGDVQVTLSWDVDSDVDLHVVGPDGVDIFYGHPTSATGGELDLDSNAGCSLDHVRNENITWPVGRAPAGRYIVRVDYWDSCGVTRTNYTVRINNGGATQIFSGTLTGTGDQGGAQSGQTIATFERQSGPAVSTLRVVPPDAPLKKTRADVKRTVIHD